MLAFTGFVPAWWTIEAPGDDWKIELWGIVIDKETALGVWVRIAVATAILSLVLLHREHRRTRTLVSIPLSKDMATEMKEILDVTDQVDLRSNPTTGEQVPSRRQSPTGD